MSYVPGVECDVFISYAHANDHEGWVSKFCRRLKSRLTEREPAVTVFHDAIDVHGNDDLSKIVQSVRRSAVLVTVVSRSYLTRPWCLTECREFLAAHALHGGDEGRIFIVRYDDVNPSSYQSVVGAKPGYEFFGKAPDGKYTDTFRPDSAAFRQKMNELRVEIHAKLQEIESSSAESSRNARPQRPVVFLADAAPGLERFANHLLSYLKSFDYEVLQPGARFYDLHQYESVYADALARSVVFVQLLGRMPVPHGDERMLSWDRWQFRKAQEAGLPTLRWFNRYNSDGTSIDLQVLDAAHREFVTEPEVWDCDAQRFREIVRGEVERRHHDLRQLQRITGIDGAKPLLVLRADRSDREFAENLGETFRRYDCDWVRIPDKDVSSLEEFAAAYAANGLLVVYRECPGKWVLARLQEVRKFLRSDFGRRWACGLWRDPTDEEDALSCTVDGLFVLGPREAGRVEDFVQALRTHT